MVGDNPHDMEEARNGGAGLAIGVLSGNAGHGDLDHLADHVIPSIAHLEASASGTRVMFYDAIENGHGFPNDPFKAIVAPRPIGWVSSLSKAGIANLAPYSFFNAVSESPHYIVFGSGGLKNSLDQYRGDRRVRDQYRDLRSAREDESFIRARSPPMSMNLR